MLPSQYRHSVPQHPLAALLFVLCVIASGAPAYMAWLEDALAPEAP